MGGMALAQDSAGYRFVGDITAQGADRLPSGKFATLRIDANVETPGGICALLGGLRDEAGEDISTLRNGLPQSLPAGRASLHIDFPGAKIAQRGVDGRLIVTGLQLVCNPRSLTNASPEASSHTRQLTGVLRAADFDDSPRDFAFVAAPAVPIAGGDPIGVSVRVHITGDFDSPIALSIDADPPLQVHAFQTWTCSANVPCWLQDGSLPLAVTSPAGISPGRYYVRIIGRSENKQRNITVPVVIDPDLTAARKRHVEAVEALKRGASNPPPEPEPDVAAVIAPAQAPPPEATFHSEVDLKKIHAVLVLDRSASMGPACEFLKASAVRFVDLFVEGRDSVAIIDFGLSVDTMLPMTDFFHVAAEQSIPDMPCIGATNTGAALEAAYAELAEHQDPDSMNAVVLFTDGIPNVLSAKWPVKFLPQRSGPSKECNESQDGSVAATFMPTYGLAFEPAGITLDQEFHLSANNPPGSCFGFSALMNYAYIPEADLNGVPLEGKRPLQRYQDGTWSGHISRDDVPTMLNAIANEVENAARRLRTAAPQPVSLYVIGFKNPKASDAVRSLADLLDLANDPAGPSFNRHEPAGHALLIDEPERFWDAFLQIREEIVKRASIR